MPTLTHAFPFWLARLASRDISDAAPDRATCFSKEARRDLVMYFIAIAQLQDGINSVLDHLLDRPQPFVGNRRYAFQAAVAWRASGRSLARCALPLWLSCGLDASSPAQSSWRAVVCKSDQETKSGKQHRTAVQAAGSI